MRNGNMPVSGLADWQLGPFEKCDEANPCLAPEERHRFACPLNGTIEWERKDVFNPAAVVRDGQVCLLYRAEDTVGKHAGTSRIGLATSGDGRSFVKRPEPVLYPGHDFMLRYEWEGGCEDPRIVEDEQGVYYLTYTVYDGKKARLAVATSRDLTSWTKRGLAFEEPYAELWTKAGAIVSRVEGDRFVAVKINGVYWMYWGESNVYAATSDDLIRWTPVLNREFRGYETTPSLLAAMVPRRNRFDSRLIEPGPQALLTERGILLLYNSKNDPEYGDRRFAPGAYCAGQALFDAADPVSLIARCEEPFLVPERSYETEGQIRHVCFIEGLVRFRGQWLLYYGTADSKIAVAACRMAMPEKEDDA